MKRVQYLLMLVFAMTVASCTKDTLPGEDTPPAVQPGVADEDLALQGWIRIKVAESATPLRVGSFTRGEVESGNADIDRIAQELGATEVKRVFSDGGKFAERRRRYGLHLWYDIRFDEEIPVSRAATELTSVPGVELCEPIYEIKRTDADADLIPEKIIYIPSAAVAAETEMPFNDPELPHQWHYHNEGGGRGFVAGADINLFEGWKYETGKPSVIVSVHDEGVKVDHEDLAAHIWVNKAELNGTLDVDDDGNGYVDDLNGWNFVHTKPAPTPDAHGTHVSGTISAINNNGIGVCGVAGGTGPDDGVRIMPLQILYGKKFATLAAETYVYAADNGAVISQNSWTLGNIGILPNSYAVAFDYFKNEAGTDENGVQTGPMKGGVIIFAAGNAGSPTLLPASSEKVIAVAASGPDYMKGAYSSCGPDTDILAPGGSGALGGGGEQVLSTYVDPYSGKDSYSYIWGTSMACPHVSGVAGLIVSHYGGQGFTAEECTKRLLNAYKPMGGIIPDDQLGDIGVGLLDAGAAFAENPGEAPAKVAEASATGEKNQIKLTWKVPADGNGAAVARYTVIYTAEGGEPVTQEIFNTYDVGSTVTYAFRAEYNTTYACSVTATDRWGNVSGVVELSVTTENFENKAPTLIKSIGTTSFPESGEENAKSYTLSEYFSDLNSLFGDVLAYTAESEDPEIVEPKISEGILTLVPKAKGSTYVTVKATDLAGESVEDRFRVTVLKGTTPGTVTATMSLYPNPADAILYISSAELKNTNVDVTVYDAAARKVVSQQVAVSSDGVGSLDVSSLSPGIYSMSVNYSGGSLKGTFMKR